MAWRKLEGFPGYFATPCPKCGQEDPCVACRSELHHPSSVERAADEREAELWAESEREYVEQMERRVA